MNISMSNCILRNLPKSSTVLSIRLAKHTRLLEVGRLTAPKDDDYKTGQLFLHKLLGYRGIILFPWPARVYNHNKKADPEELDQHLEKKGEEHTFYSALVDTRDVPFMRGRTESVTFLDHQESGHKLYAIPGLDYIAHRHVIPYLATEDHPLDHELCTQFLNYEPDKDPQFSAKNTLFIWQEMSRPWLQLSDVYMQTTEHIQVTVIPFYMGCQAARIDHGAGIVYWWRYCVCLENLGEKAVWLRERHWRVRELSGGLNIDIGQGVVGQEPVLSRELPAFQYSSHVSLTVPSGHMWGTYKMEREDGHTFDCQVPPFTLKSIPLPRS